MTGKEEAETLPKYSSDLQKYCFTTNVDSIFMENKPWVLHKDY